MNDYDPLIIDAFKWANLAVAGGVIWICMCRFSVMSHLTTRKIFRFWYVLVFVGALASGASPWLFGEHPGPGAVMLGVALLSLLLAGAPLWRNGVPADVHTRSADLDEPREHPDRRRSTA